MLRILNSTQYFQGVDAPYTKQYAIFSWGDNCLYLSHPQYFRGVDSAYSKQYVVVSGVDTKEYWYMLRKKH